MAARSGELGGALLRRFWPWLVLGLTVIPAVWHVVDFDEDIDVEFPAVARPDVQPGACVGVSAGGAGRHARPRHDLLFGGRGGAFGEWAGLQPRRWAVAGCTRDQRGALGIAGRRGRHLTAGMAWDGDRLQTRMHPSRCVRAAGGGDGDRRASLRRQCVCAKRASDERFHRR